MATKTPGQRHTAGQSPVTPWRLFVWLVQITVVLAIFTVLSVTIMRANPTLFFLSSEYMPRTSVIEIPDGEEHDETFFKYGGIGNEANEGIPFKIWSVLPEVCPQLLSDPKAASSGTRAYAEFGFLFEDGMQTPIGMSRVKLGVGGIGIEQVSINCSVCHVQTFRPEGVEEAKVFIGGVANQLRSQDYLRFISDCAATEGFSEKTLEALRRVHDMGWFERRAYRHVVIPMVLAGVDEKIRRRYAWTWRRPTWGPGRVDPFNPPKFTYLEQPIDETIGNSDMMPPWNGAAKEDLKPRANRPRTLWHWDGLSSDLKEVILNSALGDGTTAQGFNQDTMDRLYRYLRGHKSPKAADIAGLSADEALRARGAELFAERCAQCHGWQGDLFMTIIAQNDVGTGPEPDRDVDEKRASRLQQLRLPGALGFSALRALQWLPRPNHWKGSG